MLYFLISVLRAIVEMLGLCLLAQGTLYLLAGKDRQKNTIYRFFALISRGPQHIISRLLPAATGPATISILTFLLLFSTWLGLAILRKFV